MFRLARRTIKRIMDFCISAVALVLLAPLILWIAWKIKSGGKGNAIFKQARVGQNQCTFTFYKFRTMVEDAEQLQPKLKHLNEADGPAFKISNDPRLTKFGKWLRAKNLDELPQLWNVLRGEMSLVGFRPPVPSEVRQYKKWQMRRFEGKPGITSLWAIMGAHDLSFDDWIRLDIQYNQHPSLLLDLTILWVTATDIINLVLQKKEIKTNYPRIKNKKLLEKIRK